MKVYLLVKNYKNEVVSTHFGPNARRKADEANRALIGVKASVIECDFISPLEQKSLNESVKTVARPS